MIAGLVATAAVNAYNKAVSAVMPLIVPMDGNDIHINYDSSDVNARVKEMTSHLSANVLWTVGWLFVVLFVIGLVLTAFGRKGLGITMAIVSVFGGIFCFWPDTVIWVFLLIKGAVGF